MIDPIRPGGSGRRRALPEVVGSPKLPAQRGTRAMRDRSPEILRRRRVAAVLLLVGALLLTAGLVFFWWGGGGASKPAPPDFTGPAGPELVFHVAEGEGNALIGEHLVAQNVVKSKEAFLDAGLTSINPGYYVLPTKIPAALALAKLTEKGKKDVVGYLSVPGSRALDGTITTTGQRTPAIYDIIAEASCVTLNGQEHCVSADDLRATAQNATLEELGVPDWAKEGVAGFPEGVPRDRRLEGLIVGDMNFNPQSDPLTILHFLITSTAAQYRALGLLDSAKALGWTPYQTLIGASLIEREVVFPEDLPKVARVMLNRLAADQPLQFDSTINYVLDKQEVGTSDQDRKNPTLWNTYIRPGLTPSPICSPSYAAVKAMLKPADGDWMFFVTVDEKGTTLFSDTYEEHLKNVETAKANGFIPREN
ncbi:aminodeoxychorismate lyase [Segniliparus rotundus DSM 44985]|uniref:Endolytic murein transglycosylase n=1 Tax=Segniliparus rotundus (strain ATCC BAA-972 / CDC 1076 / CIP 108378 / DSM 44985 / JCM 13578) TaxID=640132 RepID=D6Z877_SEGRD|nr:endolytic transglycosylase MltG [Segniliparus rotundus]ADG98157.1 aminodeoxychorismate lyase [Segniliparus rotundus DSM 44985]